MMRKILVVVFFAAVALSGKAVFAQDNIESIVSFDADIVVNADNSVDVTESILYNTGSVPRHGIYRDIKTLSSQGRKMEINIISVTDASGKLHNYTVSRSGDYASVKIGDADMTFSGRRMYVIRYKASRAIAQFDGFDEIYWNVTGNDWNIPVYASKATVTLPDSVSSTQHSCYYGPESSVAQCDLLSGENNIYTFAAPTVLNAKEGLTVAVGFPKGLVAPYTNADEASSFLGKYLHWLIAALLPLLTLFFSLRYWYKRGRDPKGTGVIVPQYDVPDGLTPMEAVGIVKERVEPSHISAEIIYLATKGYLKIERMETKLMGLIKQTDYKLTKLKESSDLPNKADRELMNALFKARDDMDKLLKSEAVKKLPKIVNSLLTTVADMNKDDDNNKDTVKLSQLKNHFYSDVPEITKAVLNSLSQKGYYKNLGRMKTSGSRIFLVIFMSVWSAIFFGGIIGAVVLKGNPLPIMAGIFFSVIIYSIISQFSPAKTEKGVAAKEYLLGLKDYLQIAEKDRLHFHNAPEKKPEVFEKLLPYAMVLGVAQIWAKEFEDIYMAPPNWYSGPAGANFTAAAFAHDMSSFSSMASSSTSSPGGSGSGGGGSSGGGGGGGGGGGW
jgi:uncharacterized membrane protein YgcG